MKDAYARFRINDPTAKITREVVMSWINESWGRITEQTITNTWRKIRIGV